MLQYLKIPAVLRRERELNEIDLHIHTSTGSDGALPVEEVIKEAKKRNIGFMAITDHDSLVAQEKAIALTKEYGIGYITGVELNVTFQFQNKAVSLDFLDITLISTINRCWINYG